jgi:signal transduction histidine kinase
MRPSFQSLPSIDAPNADSTYAETLMGGKGLLTSLRPSEESQIHGIAISTIDRHFKYFTVWLFCTWASLVAIMYIFVPKENIVSLSGLEQRAAFMSMSLIFVSFLSRIIPLLGMGRRGHGAALNSINIGGASDGDGGFIRGIQRAWDNVMRNTSGILMGGLAIQVVAFSTDFLMAFFPVPVVLDPVLGTRVHVLRWCEWFPCATFMTFMMEGADLFWPVKEQTETGKLQKVEEQGPPPDFLQKKYMHAAAQGGAVFLGLLFPFCPGFYTWTCAMVVSCSLYSLNYPRMRQRRNEIPDTLREGATVEETERYNSAITALRLRYVCTFVWSIIVALYFVSSVGPKFAPEDSILRNPAANMCCECFFDVLSKVLFLVTIMDVHHAIFDPFARSERRLEELRKLMSAVWESSSDPIAISVRTGFNGGISTLLSPAFFALGGGRGALRRLSKDEIKDLFWNKSVLFQMPGDVLSRENGENGEIYKIKPEDILSVDFTEFSTGLGQSQGVVFGGQVVTPEMGALTAVAESVIKAWKNPRSEPVFTHELSWTRENTKKVLVYSEAKISRLDENSLIVVIRDISERVKVFETEKKILYETTSRQKDAEANRFTRHEVKNGLLAAIGLYESLCEAQGSHLFQDIAANADFGLGESDSDANVVRCMNELGKSLHETLDTIMIEAMTRDLIHDVYRPHREKCDVATVIGGFSDTVVAYDFSSAGNMSRFPLICKPSPLPCFNFDPNLLRYLHRQILSNACKYGKTGGVVLTEIIYCEQPNSLKIKVINLPGEFHEQLVAMGSEAEDAVFRKGAQIHEHMIVGADSTVGSTSKKTELAALPGDGGW